MGRPGAFLSVCRRLIRRAPAPAELEQRLGEIGDPLHGGGLHDSLSAIEESASPSLPPAPMDGQTPPPPQGMHDVDLGQAGVNELDQTLHIDPILSQVAQAAEAEQQRQRDEQRQHEQQQEQQDHDSLRDLEMPSVEHEQAHHAQSPRVSEFNMHAIDELPQQENGMHQEMTTAAAAAAAASAEDTQQDMRMDELGEGRTYSRSPAAAGQGDPLAGPSVSARSATIKQLILRLVKGVEDVINDNASPESKVGEKVVWSL